jgi:catechol 2,3-dioxygenase-like lactoylglutathione lyase family enzyme
MPLKHFVSRQAIFGLTQTQTDYVLELAFHAAHGAWLAQSDPMMAWIKALVDAPASLDAAQQFGVVYALLAKASDDLEAPILTTQPTNFAQAAFKALTWVQPIGPIRGVDHVQLAIPVGAEMQAKPFYRDLLGLTEVEKPPEMAARGGAWYENGAVKVHLGVEADFRANKKAHPAFIVDDVPRLVAKAREMGVEVKEDDALPGYVRAFLFDPFGNRIEILRDLHDND